MQAIPARTAAKLTLGAAVAAMLIATATTALRGVARVDARHADAAFFRLVRHIGPEGGEAPAMQPTLAPVGLARLHALPDVGQLLHGDGCARWDTLDNAFAHH